MKQGVPWDVAIALDGDEMAAMVIVMGELDGAEFDWTAGRFRERR